VRVGMLCRDGVRAAVRKSSTYESFLDHEQFVYTIGKCICVFCLRNKKVFVNGQVTLSQKSMVCRDVLNYYGRVLSGELYFVRASIMAVSAFALASMFRKN
jgi:hypothetical protein